MSIVVPLYDERESIDLLVENIYRKIESLECSCEIVLVDDGSADGTWEAIESICRKQPQVRGIKLRKNFGQTCALMAGFEYARGDIIITMDGDLQNDPTDIPHLIHKIEEGYDIVSGWRKHRQDPFLRVWLSRVANWIISAVVGVKLHDYGCTLKAYRASCLKSLHAYGEMHRFFPALLSITSGRIAEIVVNHRSRRFGRSKYGFSRIFKVLSDILALNMIIRFRARPLRGFFMFAVPFIGMAGFFGSLSLLAFALHWTAGKSLFYLLAASFCALAVVHLVSLGVLGELILTFSDRIHVPAVDIDLKEISIDGTARVHDFRNSAIG